MMSIHGQEPVVNGIHDKPIDQGICPEKYPDEMEQSRASNTSHTI